MEVIDRGWEQTELDSKETKEAEDNTKRDLENPKNSGARFINI